MTNPSPRRSLADFPFRKIGEIPQIFIAMKIFSGTDFALGGAKDTHKGVLQF